jgi:hypothetical protein
LHEDEEKEEQVKHKINNWWGYWWRRNSIFRYLYIEVGIFIDFHKLIFRLLRGTCQRVRERGDTWFGAFTMASEEIEREQDEEMERLLKERDRLISRQKDLEKGIKYLKDSEEEIKRLKKE